MSHAMFGWMERDDGEFGEIFEPKTVKQKMDLASQSTVCIPVIFDCQTREVIWCDMNLTINGFTLTVEATTQRAIFKVLQQPVMLS